MASLLWFLLLILVYGNDAELSPTFQNASQLAPREYHRFLYKLDVLV